MSRIFSINFKIVPEEKAVVSVMDRSFLYGDSVYEVIRTYRGNRLFLADRHYQRLLRSSERIGLAIPFSQEVMAQHMKECVEKANLPEAYIRIIVSRGSDTRFDLAIGEHLEPTTVILVDEVRQAPSRYFTDGVEISLVSIRRNPKNALDPNIKSGNYMNNVLALMEARKKGAIDAVMLNSDGCVTEATTSNVFVAKDGVLRTPNVQAGILEGISRGLIKEICANNQIPLKEAAITKKEFLSSEEIFLSGTIKEILPVTKVNGASVGTGKPGPLTQKMMKLWQGEIDKRTKG